MPPPFNWLNYYSSTEWAKGALMKLFINSTCNYGGGTKNLERQDYWFTGVDPTQPGCGGCRSTLNCPQSSPINIKCPGCTEGIANVYMKIKRKNYGLTDNNNDRIADDNLTAENPNIFTKRATYNDTLVLEQLGVVYTSSIPYFSNGYGVVRSTNLDQSYYQPAGGYVKIKSAASGITYTCDLANSVKIGSNVYYDYSPAALAANGCGIPSGYQIDNGDSVWVYQYMRISRNIGNTIEEKQFESILYVSDVDLSNFATAQTPFICNYNTSLDPSCHVFFCNSSQANFNIVGYSQSYNYYGFQKVAGCNLYNMYFADYNYMGGSWETRPFPYETRYFTYPASYTFVIPPGYNVKEAWLRQYRSLELLIILIKMFIIILIHVLEIPYLLKQIRHSLKTEVIHSIVL